MAGSIYWLVPWVVRQRVVSLIPLPHIAEPYVYNGDRDPKRLDTFLFNMEQYFKAMKANSE